MFNIPLSDTTLGEEEVEAATRVLRRKWVTMGEEVAAFEAEFAKTMGCHHAIAVNNGTQALEITYAVSGLGPGDEVILPTITFIACLNAARRLGARVVLADITSEQDLTICPKDIRNKTTSHTRMVVPMAHGGCCPDMKPIMAHAKALNWTVIEDSCHAPLATLDGKNIGTFGKAGTWSFFGNKNMTTGEGGMITTDDDQFAATCRLMRSHGITRTTWDRAQGHASDYDIALAGTNARMDEIRAAIGRVQLTKLPEATARRKQVALWLRGAIEEQQIPELIIPGSTPRGQRVHHVFCVLLPCGTDRPLVMEQLKALGIQSSIHYPALHHFTSTKQYFQSEGQAEELPQTEAIAPRILTLPLGPGMTPQQCEQVAKALKKVLSA